MIKYPENLNSIFETLYKNNIKPVIVGGYIRDYFLGITSNDIDIELYNISSLKKVEKILQNFGTVNSVGKSFGVCKLKYKDLDLDFSLPRIDNKIASGHQGFQIKIYTDLDFKTASSRRDFTINSMGYDIKNKKLLDPHNGMQDLKKQILRAVDIQKFCEDPLRILRAIVFSSRFNFKLDDNLFFTCKQMIEKKLLNELPKERIFEEIKKLILKSKTPSSGFYLLKKLKAFLFFKEFKILKNNEYDEILKNLDMLKNFKITDNKELIILSLAVITSKFSDENIINFLKRITNEKKLIEKIFTINKIIFSLDSFNNYDIYSLATKIDIKFYGYYLYATNRQKDKIKKLLKKAKKLEVLHQPLPALIEGKDLITFGLKPSKNFSYLIDKAYQAQINGKFHNKKNAKKWLQKNYFIPF